MGLRSLPRHWKVSMRRISSKAKLKFLDVITSFLSYTVVAQVFIYVIELHASWKLMGLVEDQTRETSSVAQCTNHSANSHLVKKHCGYLPGNISLAKPFKFSS